MPKRRKNRSPMTSAFIIPGIEFINDKTANLRPSFLDTILKGLNTLSILNTLMKFTFKSSNTIEIIYNCK